MYCIYLHHDNYKPRIYKYHKGYDVTGPFFKVTAAIFSVILLQNKSLCLQFSSYNEGNMQHFILSQSRKLSFNLKRRELVTKQCGSGVKISGIWSFYVLTILTVFLPLSTCYSGLWLGRERRGNSQFKLLLVQIKLSLDFKFEVLYK